VFSWYHISIWKKIYNYIRWIVLAVCQKINDLYVKMVKMGIKKELL